MLFASLLVVGLYPDFCIPAFAGVSSAAGIPAVAGVSAADGIPAVAGVSAAGGIPPVAGASAVAGVYPRVPALAGVPDYRLSDQYIAFADLSNG